MRSSSERRKAVDKKIYKKKGYLLIALAAVGIFLMLLPSLQTDKEESKAEDFSEIEYYSERIEKKLEALVSKSAGVGDVAVVVTLESAGESVFAKDETTESGRTSGDYVIISTGDGEAPVLISKIYPRVRGVAVVCNGGDDAEVKSRVTLLISAALGISTNKIAVSG